MLIVGREIGQSVIIGETIKVTIQQFGPKLRLAVEAPKHICVSQIKQNRRVKLKKGVKMLGDTVLIADLIKVTLLQTESGLLRFAIDAPKEIGIFREELFKSEFLSENQKVGNL
ncbi:carbon storage regulator [Neobacillus niacini]|uniref:carbon storage regulator n=1 Tax=Neobacillus niacini TaxID=86668 RepID=UPI0028610A12|nr:carbon storage regulator [Neobacillus niacini]MDR7001000.1 carbon storage regulator CsrA [Neobacillus niacini]